MHPSAWCEYIMQVGAMTGLDAHEIMERHPLACGKQAQALWYQSKHLYPVLPGMRSAASADAPL